MAFEAPTFEVKRAAIGDLTGLPPRYSARFVHPGKKPGDRVMLDGIEQILWPVHCVQNTHGAEFARRFDTSRVTCVFHKGIEPTD